MLAPFGDTHHFTNSALAARGVPLIQRARPSNAPDNSIGKFADWLKSIPRSTYPRLISLASIFSQLLRTWPGSRQNGASGPFPFFHVVPRVLGSLCGGKNHSCGGFAWSDRSVVEKKQR